MTYDLIFFNLSLFLHYKKICSAIYSDSPNASVYFGSPGDLTSESNRKGMSAKDTIA